MKRKSVHLGLAVASPRSSLARKQVEGELGVQDVKICAISIGYSQNTRGSECEEKRDVVPCLGENRGDLHRCDV